MHLNKIMSFIVFAAQKHYFGTKTSTFEQVHQQVPLFSFKTKVLEYTKWSMKSLLRQFFFEKGLFRCQKLSKSCFITSCRRKRLDDVKDRKLICIALIRLFMVHRIKNPHFAFPSWKFLFKMFCVPFKCGWSLLGSFSTSFLFKFCFPEFKPLLSNIRTKNQLSFAASVLKDLTNIRRNFVVNFQYYLVTNS